MGFLLPKILRKWLLRHLFNVVSALFKPPPAGSKCLPYKDTTVIHKLHTCMHDAYLNKGRNNCNLKVNEFIFY